MTQTFEIPLTPAAQTFLVTLVGVQYQFTLQWRDAEEGGWTLDIADSGGSPIVSGVPLVTGVDLLAQYQYLGIGGELWVQTDVDPAAVPTYDNLGTASHVYFVVP
jgi:hypothetical protein